MSLSLIIDQGPISNANNPKNISYFQLSGVLFSISDKVASEANLMSCIRVCDIKMSYVLINSLPSPGRL